MSQLSRKVRARPRRIAGSRAYPWVSGAVLTVCAALEVWMFPTGPLVTVSVLVSAGSLMWRAAYPSVTLLTVAAVMLSFGAADGSALFTTAAVSGIVGCYTLGRERVRHPVVLITCGFLASLCANIVHIRGWQRDHPDLILGLLHGSSLSPGMFAETFVLTVAILGAVSAGDAVRARQETRHERATAQERLIAMERRQAAEAERAAIARELHDLVAHSVSMIAVRAESATYTTPDLSPEARTAFQDIAGTARSSMAELRRLLGVLRTRDERAETSPQPTLDRIGELIEQHRVVGGRAELRISGERVALSASWELSAYRIVQEALTNARRHAPGARTLVEIDYLADRLDIRVRDDGPGPAAPTGASPGHGLAGMRERAALLGGRLRTGPGPGGGFLMEAELPW